MSLRAEQWMMLGVVAIGVYAAYRLTKADGGTRAEVTPLPFPEPRPLIAGASPLHPTPPSLTSLRSVVAHRAGPLSLLEAHR